MEKSIRFIQLIILVDVVYAFINLFSLGKFIPLIPLFEVFIFLIFSTAWIFSTKRSISINYLSLLIGLVFLPSSEFVVSSIFSREWTSFIMKDLSEVFLVVQYLLLLIMIVLLVINNFKGLVLRFALSILAISFTVVSIFDLTILSLVMLISITTSLFIVNRKKVAVNTNKEKYFTLANNSFIGFAVIFIFHELVLYFS